MTAALLMEIDEVAAQWRLGSAEAEGDNPAGPLFASGRYAASEITADVIAPFTPDCHTLQYTPCVSICLECRG